MGFPGRKRGANAREREESRSCLCHESQAMTVSYNRPFRDTLSMWIQTNPRSKAFIWNWVWFAWKWTCRGSTSSYEWFCTDSCWHRGTRQLRNDLCTSLNFLFNSYRKLVSLNWSTEFYISPYVFELLQINIIQFFGKRNVVVPEINGHFKLFENTETIDKVKIVFQTPLL